ncbi:hypothetical protein BaRGS_00032162 [Batillaria attramentaria]|uniref:Uncharacterized protein n=1 Tax=Batillaria attramentaria TaxID=370345 RepID=A0ABD0JNP6_9CAEN
MQIFLIMLVHVTVWVLCFFSPPQNRQTKFRTSALADPYNTADQPVNLVVSESEYQYAVDLSSSTNRHTPSAATAISPPPSGIACDRAGPSYYVVPHEWDMSSLSPYGPPVPQQLMPSFMYALSTWQFQQQYLSPVDPYSYLARPAAPVHQQLVLNSSPPPEPNQFGSSGQCLSSVHKH